MWKTIRRAIDVFRLLESSFPFNLLFGSFGFAGESSAMKPVADPVSLNYDIIHKYIKDYVKHWGRSSLVAK